VCRLAQDLQRRQADVACADEDNSHAA
jgi:hypothetical protein